MGNNKKTVKCSFCNRLGHNRVSCEKYKISIEKIREKHGNDHPDVADYDTYKQRYSKKSQSNANTSRRCSYCLKASHNVRTCNQRSTDIIKLKKLNKEWRNSILKELQGRGIGVGTIMANSGYISAMQNKKSPWTLVSIDWDNLSWVIDNKKVFRLILMSNPAISKEVTLEQILNDSPTYIYRWDVLSKSGTLDFPDKWNTVSDPTFDRNCIEIFKGLTKAEYDTFFFSLYSQKPPNIQFLIPTGDDSEEE